MGYIIVGIGLVTLSVAMLMGKPFTINITNTTKVETPPPEKIALLPQDDEVVGDSKQSGDPIRTEDLARTIQDFIFGEDA